MLVNSGLVIGSRFGQQVSKLFFTDSCYGLSGRDAGTSQRVKPGRLGSNLVDSVNAQSTVESTGQSQPTRSTQFVLVNTRSTQDPVKF
ncbi:hypothetical protein HanIR_Chr07g0331501 [Helianthus annuus]|nr:hypothetical protein HanIR_Chr07g0331501 [Helianthus annuus]